MFDHLGDEILTHGSLGTGGASNAAGGATVHDLADGAEVEGEGAGGEEEDDEVPHPVLVNNWSSGLKVGQVAAVAMDGADNPVVFHRGCHVWDAKWAQRKKIN